MIGYIYKHTSPSGRSYIGQTIKKLPEKRWGKRGQGYFKGNAKDHKFIRAIKKYGWENFTHEILEVIEIEDKQELLDKLNPLEEYYIKKFDTFNNGYNSTTGGDNRKLSEETCMKISKGNKENLGGVRAMQAYNLGKHHSDEWKQKIRDSVIMSHRNNPNYIGVGEKISLILKSKNLVSPNKGKKFSGELKAKIAMATKEGMKKVSRDKLIGQKGKHWYTNGKLNFIGYQCPEGFWPGRSQNLMDHLRGLAGTQAFDLESK